MSYTDGSASMHHATHSTPDNFNQKATTMKTTRAILLAGFLALVSLTIAGCAGVHDPHATHAQNAVTCDKCKTTFVNISHTTYRHNEQMKVMTCPDCESAVENFFKTGHLKHHCNHCGGSMTCFTAQ